MGIIGDYNEEEYQEGDYFTRDFEENIRPMSTDDFVNYKKQINSDYHDLIMDLCKKLNIFAIDLCRYKKKSMIAFYIVQFMNDDLQVTASNGFDINILTYSEVIKLAETLNKQYNTRYKPTFLTDVENYKSIREGF
jgi:hydroxymethylpyrimidine pyrophosphatase-like HAD family hydrolase